MDEGSRAAPGSLSACGIYRLQDPAPQSQAWQAHWAQLQPAQLQSWQAHWAQLQPEAACWPEPAAR